MGGEYRHHLGNRRFSAAVAEELLAECDRAIVAIPGSPTILVSHLDLADLCQIKSS